MRLPPQLADNYPDFVERWLLGGPDPLGEVETVEALAALNRHCPERIDSLLTSTLRGPAVIAPLIHIGRVLSFAEHMTGSASVIARLRAGERAAHSELTVAWLLGERGCVVELEPALEGSVPDLAIELAGSRVFVEVVSPDPADATKQSQRALEAVVERLSQTNSGDHVDVLLDPEFDLSRLDELARHIESVKRNDEARLFPELASVLRRAAEIPVQAVSEHVRPPGPALWSSRGAMADGVASAVTVGMPVSDERAQRVLSAELHHFSRASKNLIVMDVAGVAGGTTDWARLIRRCFQPTRNTRVGGVLLLAAGLAGNPLQVRHWGKYLRNPHALLPLPLELEELLGSIPERP